MNEKPKFLIKNIEELIPYENNPRNNDAAVPMVAESIKEFGFKVPIIIDKDNVIIAGHTRLKAAKMLGLKEVPCIMADDLTDEQAKAFRLADNKVAELSEWNFEKLEIELEGLDDIYIDTFDLDFNDNLGFSDFDEVDEDAAEKTIEYFDAEEIRQDIIDGWKSYESVHDFIKTIIDMPTAKYQFNRLCNGYNDGTNISLLFNPHRLETETKKSKSIFFGFNSDEKYKKEFAREVVTYEKVVPTPQYYKYIGVGHASYQYVNEFRPSLARDIYKKYCNDGDKILNPCAGWGGRLIGLASCMFKNIEYVETEPATQTYNGLVKLKKFLMLGENYKQYNLPFENLEVKNNYFDFVFTSPPYFDTEHYSNENTQSYLKYKNYEEWKTGFLFSMLDKIIKAMKVGAICILNVGNNIYPLEKDTKEHLSRKHGIIAHDEGTVLSNCDGFRQAKEPFILFRKQ